MINVSFNDLSINPSFLKGLEEQGITSPTEIQSKTIPLAVSGRDVIGIAKTGSGKTLAFGIPVLEKVVKGGGVQAIVLSPTRELAVQISSEFEKLSRTIGLRIATIYGGVAFDPQVRALSRAEVVVGTPGRVLDHLRQGTLDPSLINLVVLDEADKMVSMGFIDDIKTIISAVPNKPQFLLFGATVSQEVDSLKRDYMVDPAVVRAETSVDQSLLEQFYYDTVRNEKFSLLVHLLKKGSDGKVIVFCSTIRTVELVADNLKRQGFRVLMIHGKMSQSSRLRMVDAFNNSEADLLVASPVAARGIHVDDVSLVINYDLSRDAEEYVHRVGRTARAGNKGRAVTLLSDEDHAVFQQIINRFSVPVVKLEKESFPRVNFVVRSPGRGRDRSSSRPGFGRGSRSGSNRGFSAGSSYRAGSRNASRNSSFHGRRFRR